MDERRVQESARHGDVALEPMLRVEYCDMKFFDGKILETLPENLMDVARASHRYAFVALLRCHAPAELERSVDRNGACRAGAGPCRPGSQRLPIKPPERTVRAGGDCGSKAD